MHNQPVQPDPVLEQQWNELVVELELAAPEPPETDVETLLQFFSSNDN